MPSFTLLTISDKTIGGRCRGKHTNYGRGAKGRGMAGDGSQPAGRHNFYYHRLERVRVYRLRSESVRTPDVYHSSRNSVHFDRHLALGRICGNLER